MSVSVGRRRGGVWKSQPNKDNKHRNGNDWPGDEGSIFIILRDEAPIKVWDGVSRWK